MLVTVALLVLLVRLVDVPSVTATLLSAKVLPVVGATGVAVLDRILMVVKWYPLLRVQLESVSILVAGRAYLASGIANYVLPASVGADAVRAVALGRGRSAVVEIGASIVAERVLGLVATAVMAVVAVGLARHHGIPLGTIVPWALFAVALGVAVLVVPMTPGATRRVRRLVRVRPNGRWVQYLNRFGRAYATYRRRPRLLFVVGLLTLFEQLLPVASTWLGAQALGLTVGFGPMIVAVTLTMFAARLPVSIAGLGVGEGALVYLLGLYGVPASEALALALLGRVVEALVNAGPAVVLWRDLVRARGLAAAPRPGDDEAGY